MPRPRKYGYTALGKHKASTARSRTYISKRRNKATRKRYRKRGGAFRNYVSSSPFPTYYKCKMYYSHVLTALTPQAVTGFLGTEQIFRLNSLYDPDYSGTGQQPYGFDQMASLYRKYKVNGVKIDVTIYNPNEDGVLVGALIQPPGGTATLTGKTMEDIAELPMCTYRVLHNTGTQRSHFSQYMPINKLAGISPLQFKANIEDFASLCTTSPAQFPYFRIAVGSIIGSTSATCQITVKLTFYSTFYERIQQAASS